jgi:hypothetical protein
VVNIGWAGWCKEGTSDKVWGYFAYDQEQDAPLKRDGTYYIFWAGRGKKMNFKQASLSECQRVTHTKQKKYDPLYTHAKLLSIWPTFDDEVEQRLCYCVLAGKVK